MILMNRVDGDKRASRVGGVYCVHANLRTNSLRAYEACTKENRLARI